MPYGYYSTGTMSVPLNGMTVAGTGVAWSEVREHALIFGRDDAGHMGFGVVDSATANTLPLKTKWCGDALTNAEYVIINPADMTQVAIDMAAIATSLRSAGVPVIVPGDMAAPDPSWGFEEQTAVQPSPGRYWTKTAGLWVEFANPRTVPGGGMLLHYDFSAATGIVDPTAGKMSIVGATQSTTVKILFDLLDAFGVARSTAFAVIGGSTNVNKGQLRLVKQGAAETNFLEFNVTGVTVGADYVTIDGAVIAFSAANPFAAGDRILGFFSRAGNVGPQGPAGPAFSGSQPKFSVHRNGANVAGLAANQSHLITFTEARFNSGQFVGDTFTPNVAGQYQISAGTGFLGCNAGARVFAQLLKNGATIHQGATYVPTAASNGSAVCAALIDMNGITDTIKVAALHTDTVARDLNGSALTTWATGIRVG